MRWMFCSPYIKGALNKGNTQLKITEIERDNKQESFVGNIRAIEEIYGETSLRKNIKIKCLD